MPLKRLQDHRARSDHRVICLRAHACDRAQARFFGETSMHGVQHVTDDECPIGDNHPLRRLCWFMVVVIAFVCLSIFIQERVDYYYSYPIATATSMETEGAIFPHITLCSISPISVQKMTKAGVVHKPPQQYSGKDVTRFGRSFGEVVQECDYRSGGVSTNCIPANTECYLHGEFLAIPGHNVRTYTGQTAIQCKALCTRDPLCKAVDFATTRNPNTKGGNGVYATGTCVINDDPIFKYYGQAPGYQNLDYYAKTPCTPAQKKMSASSRRDTKMTSCLFPLLVSLFFPKP